MVTKEQILDHIWTNRFVSESVLTRNIAELRRLLAEATGDAHVIETIPKRGYRLIASVETCPRETPPRLAVLLFDNLHRDPEQEYFAEGVSDALITELGNIASLRVISRQSVLHFKGSNRSIPEIARELHVDAVVEGSVLHAGSRVRITAQLIQAQPERHLWAQSYECELKDVLEIQARVARAIAESVQAALTPDDVARLSRPRVTNPKALLAYLKARYHAVRWTQDDVQKALHHLHEAMQLDPAYAPPYELMAVSLGVLGFWGHLPIGIAYPEARTAARRALELDGSSADALATLGFVKWHLDWDLAGAERDLRRATEINASSEFAHMAYGKFLLVARGARAGAHEQARVALSLDPLSLSTNFSFAWFLLFAGEYEEAVAHARKTLSMFPDSVQAYYVLGSAELARSNFRDAVAAFETAAAHARDNTSLSYWANALGRAGQEEAARAILGELRSLREREFVPEFSFAVAYAGMGDVEAAFDALERCLVERDCHLFWLDFVPFFDAMRGDPRFADLQARILGATDAHPLALPG